MVDPTIVPAGAGSISTESKPFNYAVGNFVHSGTAYRWTVVPAGGWKKLRFRIDTHTVYELYSDGEVIRRVESDDFWDYCPSPNPQSPMPSTDAELYEYSNSGNGDRVTILTLDDHRFERWTVTVTSLYVEFTESSKIAVGLIASPSEGGTVAGGGSFDRGQTCTVTATPSQGWRFQSWSDGGAQTHSFTVESDVTLTASFVKVDTLVTVVASPDQYGTVTGGGYYAIGDVCTVTAAPKTVAGKKLMFLRWSDGGAATHSFVVSGPVELTSFFCEYGDVYIGCYSRNASWYRATPWKATVSYGGNSVTWDGNTDDVNRHIRSLALQVPIGGRVDVSTSLTSAQVPAQMQYDFNGFYGFDPGDGSKPLLSTSQTFQYTVTRSDEWLLPLFDSTVKCSLIPFRSLGYKDSSSYKRERLASVAAVERPVVTLGTGASVQLTDCTDHWEFDLKWDQTVLDGIPSVAQGFESLFEMKVLIRPTKTAENDVSVGAFQVVSDAFQLSTTTGRAKKFSIGVHTRSEYATTGVPFSDAYSFYLCQVVQMGLSTSRAEIKCDFAMGPLINWVISASSGLDVDRAAITNDGYNFTKFFGSLTNDNGSSAYKAIELSMISAFKSGGVYSFRFPASATVLNGAVLRYFNGTTDNSLSIRLTKNGVAQEPVKRDSGESLQMRFSGYGTEYAISSLLDSDVLDVIMHVGTFLPLRNASGYILRGVAGDVLNDS